MSDLISRQDIKYHVQLEAMGNGQYEEVEIAYKNDIESLPSAEPNTGEWVKVIDEETPNVTKWHYECDQCGQPHGRSKYCPNCGARMLREDGEGCTIL